MEKVKKTTFFTAKNITYFAVLVALVVVLQMCSSFIHIGSTTFALVLVPIALGGMLMGVGVGAALGAIFGLVVIIAALSGLDAFTLYLLNESPAITVILCLVKGTAAGAISALLFKLISKKNKYVAVFVAAAAVPIINTGIFAIGAFCIIDTISVFFAEGSSVAYIVFVGCIGVNFFVELATSLICSPALYTVDRVLEKQIAKNSKMKAKASAHTEKAEASEVKENDNLS